MNPFSSTAAISTNSRRCLWKSDWQLIQKWNKLWIHALDRCAQSILQPNLLYFGRCSKQLMTAKLIDMEISKDWVEIWQIFQPRHGKEIECFCLLSFQRQRGKLCACREIKRHNKCCKVRLKQEKLLKTPKEASKLTWVSSWCTVCTKLQIWSSRGDNLGLQNIQTKYIGQ